MAERIVALAVLVAGGIYLAQAFRLPFGAMARPGPGFFPLAVAAFACAVALVLTAIAFRRVGGGDPAATPEPPPAGRRHVWPAVATLAGFCVLLPWIGYPLAALLFVATLLRQLGAGWRGTLIVAALSAEGSYYLFAILLGVTLPRGLWPH